MFSPLVPTSSRRRLYFPKFSLSGKRQLEQLLPSMGMSDISSYCVGITGISLQTIPLRISRVSSTPPGVWAIYNAPPFLLHSTCTQGPRHCHVCAVSWGTRGSLAGGEVKRGNGELQHPSGVLMPAAPEKRAEPHLGARGNAPFPKLTMKASTPALGVGRSCGEHQARCFSAIPTLPGGQGSPLVIP